jgi:hypothetical protein
MESRQDRVATSRDVLKLLTGYDEHKGKLRSASGDSGGVKELRDFYNRYLADKDGQTPLSDMEIQGLKTLLMARFARISESSRSYRSAPDKQTNIVYTNLAKLISEHTHDKKILAMVQGYKNDYASHKILLFNYPGEVFHTQSGYALPLSQLIDTIRNKQTLIYNVYDKNGEKSVCAVLTEQDIAELCKIPEAKAAIEEYKQAADRGFNRRHG